MKYGTTRVLIAAVLGLLLQACGSSTTPLPGAPLPEVPDDPGTPTGPLEPVIRCAPEPGLAVTAKIDCATPERRS